MFDFIMIAWQSTWGVCVTSAYWIYVRNRKLRGRNVKRLCAELLNLLVNSMWSQRELLYIFVNLRGLHLPPVVDPVDSVTVVNLCLPPSALNYPPAAVYFVSSLCRLDFVLVCVESSPSGLSLVYLFYVYINLICVLFHFPCIYRYFCPVYILAPFY